MPLRDLLPQRLTDWLDDRAAIKRIEEALGEQGRRDAPPGVRVYNPSYEQYVRETEAGRNGPDAWRDHTDRMGTTPPQPQATWEQDQRDALTYRSRHNELTEMRADGIPEHVIDREMQRALHPDGYDMWSPVTGTFADPDRAAELNAEGFAELIARGLADNDVGLLDRQAVIDILGNASIYLHGAETANRPPPTIASISSEWASLRLSEADATLMLDRAVAHLIDRQSVHENDERAVTHQPDRAPGRIDADNQQTLGFDQEAGHEDELEL